MAKEKLNLWPHAIALSIFGVFGLCVWTVKEANNHPVEMDSFYFDKYQNVDDNYNKIMLQKQKFDSLYSIDVISPELATSKESSIILKITHKDSSKPINDAKVEVLVTRPDTTRLDKHLKVLSAKDGVYNLSPFKVEKLGRWQIMSKVTIDNLTTFNKLEVNATK